MHFGVFLIQSASFIHLVCRCASLSTAIYRVTCKNCSSSYVGETMQEVWSEDQGTQERSGLFHSWYTVPSRQGKEEQCNSQVSHHRPCRGREPCHQLAQAVSGRQRGTATNQMDKRGTLDQEDTEWGGESRHDWRGWRNELVDSRDGMMHIWMSNLWFSTRIYGWWARKGERHKHWNSEVKKI